MNDILNETIDPLYLKGFNNGYIIEQHQPKLLKEVLSGIENNSMPYVQGMRAGAKEHQRELFKLRIENAQQENKSNNYDVGEDLSHNL